MLLRPYYILILSCQLNHCSCCPHAGFDEAGDEKTKGPIVSSPCRADLRLISG